MSGNPFVRDVQVRREILDREIARLHELPYLLWREIVTSPIAKTVKASNNRSYSLTITAHFVRGTDDISVTLSLTRRGLIRRGSIRQNFVITPDNELRL